MTIQPLRRAAPALLILPALAFAACGSSGGGSSDAKDQITSIIKQAGDDPASSCEHFTQQLIKQRFNGSVAQCRKVADSDPKNRDPNVQVDSVTVNGNTAVAHITENSGKTTLRFVKQGGDWKIVGGS